MNIDALREHRTGSILRFSIPAIIGMVLTALITIADGYFMGNFIDKDAIAAVNLGLPIIYLYLAVGLMISVGGSVISGMSLGAGDMERCGKAFNQTMLSTAAIAFLLSIAVLFSFTPILKMLRAEGKVAAYFGQYYHIMLLELPLMIINSSFGMFIRTEGNPHYYMNVSILTVLTNIVLDWAFAGPCHWGVRGIAWASFASALLGFVCIMYYFMAKSKTFHFRHFDFDWKIFKDTMLNGSSEFIGELSMCISMGAYNFVIMRRIGVDGVTAFTIVGYTAYIFSMIVVGFGQGVSPIISFAYGGGDRELARSIRRRTIALVTGTGALFVILSICCSLWYSRIFVSDRGIQTMVQQGMLIFMSDFLLCGANAISSFYFTSIGRAKESAVISSARGLVILLASIFLLPALFGMNGVWLTSPVTEMLTLIITACYLKQDIKEVGAAAC